jgi:hypothetical protein
MIPVTAALVTYGNISDNYCNTGTSAIFVDKSDYLTIARNHADNFTGVVFDINDCDHCTIGPANITNAGTRSIDVSSSDYLHVVDNHFWGGTQYGIFADACNPCVIDGNTIASGGASTADISVTSSTAPTVNNNICSRSVVVTGTGVTMVVADISNNTVRSGIMTITPGAATQLNVCNNKINANVATNALIITSNGAVTVGQLNVIGNNVSQASAAVGSGCLSITMINATCTRALIASNITNGGLQSIYVQTSATSMAIRNNEAPKLLYFNGNATILSVTNNEIADGYMDIGCTGAVTSLQINGNIALYTGTIALAVSLSGTTNLVAINNNNLLATAAASSQAPIVVTLIGAITVSAISVFGNTTRNTSNTNGSGCCEFLGASGTANRIFASTNMCVGGARAFQNSIGTAPHAIMSNNYCSNSFTDTGVGTWEFNKDAVIEDDMPNFITL